MNKINKVYFRKDQDTSGYEGKNQRNWFGEDSFAVGEMVWKREITEIELGSMGYNMNFDVPVIRVLVGEKVFCEIPMTSVCRIYYSLED